MRAALTLGVGTVCLALVAVAIGCADQSRDKSKSSPRGDVRESGPDPEPEKLDGSESHEFEEEDLEAARDAGRLRGLYCKGTSSEAQYEGCLSHVVEEDICSQDTSAKQDAVAAYIEETGDSSICG
jgi:hypothetical protein